MLQLGISPVLAAFTLLLLNCTPMAIGDAIATPDGVAYQAETRLLEDHEPPALDLRVTATNVSGRSVRLEYGQCSLSLRVHDNAQRSGAPVAQGGGSGYCLRYLAYKDLEPGDSLSPGEFQLSVPVADILGDALPEGRYYFTAVLKVNGESVEIPAGEADLARDQGEPSLDNVDITCDPQRPSSQETEDQLSEIPEPAVRAAMQRARLRGTGEIVPGFGGVFVDRQDNDIAYIYLLDPDDEELVAQAAEILRSRPGGREFREVRAIQGQFSYSQLLEWINCWDAREPRLSRTTASGISEGSNRILVGVGSEADVARAERELEALGIPLEAAEIRVIGGLRPG